ncbi:hypothetical protein LTR50_002157 [Elasticomyces elasticus]|nr:hypothetical protein LTR50_002157 [Elasticomyces elasticus]
MVNNAGITAEGALGREAGDQPIWNVAEDTWDRTMRVNAKGVFLGYGEAGTWAEWRQRMDHQYCCTYSRHSDGDKNYGKRKAALSLD